MKILDSLGQHRLLGGAIVLAITQFGASLAGLVRDRILAGTFPELGAVDVYIAAFRPSDLLFQVCIMSAMGTVLVPMLATYKAKDDKVAMGKLLSGTMGMGGLVFGAIALVLSLLMPWIASTLVHFEGEQLALYVRFARIALFTNFLFVFGNACGQYLITIQKYWIYGLTPILYTAGTIFGTLFLTDSFGTMGPMYGTLIGAIIYVIFRIGAVLWFGSPLSFTLWHPDLHEMGLLMLPRMLALGAMQVQLLFFDSIGSGLDTGAITVNAYARNFQSVVVGIAGIAVAQSAYSLLSQAAAQKDSHRFFIYLKRGIGLLLALTIPGATLLVFLAPVAATLVNVSQVLAVFTVCLLFYAISIPFESVNHLLLRSYYAMKNTFIPATWMVLGGAFAIATAWFLKEPYGVYSLAIGFTVGQIVQTLGLSILLTKKVRALS